MHSSWGYCIADALRASLSYAQRLQEGITDANHARLARPGGQVIPSNHAAFVFGHLALYPPRVLAQLGQATAAVPLPPAFETLFSKDAACLDDTQGTIYPARATIMEAFSAGHQAVLSLLPDVAEEVWQQPNPTESMRERFPSLGSLHNFYLGSHVMLHLGQLSAWRRMLELPPA